MEMYFIFSFFFFFFFSMTFALLLLLLPSIYTFFVGFRQLGRFTLCVRACPSVCTSTQNSNKWHIGNGIFSFFAFSSRRHSNRNVPGSSVCWQRGTFAKHVFEFARQLSLGKHYTQTQSTEEIFFSYFFSFDWIDGGDWNELKSKWKNALLLSTFFFSLSPSIGLSLTFLFPIPSSSHVRAYEHVAILSYVCVCVFVFADFIRTTNVEEQHRFYSCRRTSSLSSPSPSPSLMPHILMPFAFDAFAACVQNFSHEINDNFIVAFEKVYICAKRARAMRSAYNSTAGGQANSQAYTSVIWCRYASYTQIYIPFGVHVTRRSRAVFVFITFRNKSINNIIIWDFDLLFRRVFVSLPLSLSLSHLNAQSTARSTEVTRLRCTAGNHRTELYIRSMWFDV